MKIGYIVVNENLGTELIRRQVIELLVEIKIQKSDVTIFLLNFQSIPSIVKHIKTLQEVTRELSENNIHHYVLPNISPWPIPNLKLKKLFVGWRPHSVWNRFAALFFSVGALPFFFMFNKVLGIKIFHCRSYPATLAAVTYKKISKDVKVIFDPRSDFPEEGITVGSWQKNSRDLLFWKGAEKKLLEESNVTALIGPTYLRHYQESTSRFKYFFAPNNVVLENFRRNKVPRAEIRRELGIANDDIVFVYLGALTKDGWHRTSFYKKFYESVVSKNIKYFLLILTPEVYVGDVKNEFFESPNVYIISPAYTQIGNYLSAADVGLMFLHCKKIAVGTKIGEYLCCDIPVIVNSNCEGAVDLITANPQYGYVIGLGLGDADTSMHFDQQRINELSEYRPSKEASLYFDVKRIAEVYLKQYDAV